MAWSHLQAREVLWRPEVLDFKDLLLKISEASRCRATCALLLSPVRHCWRTEDYKGIAEESIHPIVSLVVRHKYSQDLVLIFGLSSKEYFFLNWVNSIETRNWNPVVSFYVTLHNKWRLWKMNIKYPPPVLFSQYCYSQCSIYLKSISLSIKWGKLFFLSCNPSFKVFRQALKVLLYNSNLKFDFG